MKRRAFFASLFAPLLAPLLVKKAAAAPVKPYLVMVDWSRDMIELDRHHEFLVGWNAKSRAYKRLMDFDPPDPFAKLDVSKNRETIYFHSQPPREAPATMGL